MPPNIQQQVEQASFIDHFWSKDKSGMDTLLNYMSSTHRDLEMIHQIYVQRSIMENEFGERLLDLYNKYKRQEEDAQQGVSAAYNTVSEELNRTATTHLELSEALADQVAAKCQAKLTEYQELLSKWTVSLNDLYQVRKEKILQLLKIRAQYTKEHDISKGKSTPTLEALSKLCFGQVYKNMVIKVDEGAQEWNSAWEEACEVMEAMEKDRVEFLKCNVWDYANQMSSTLLVQDECCENIRAQLEKCHAEQEIEKCISLLATGTEIPTTKEYVDELAKEQKKKNQTERRSTETNLPKPPSKSARQQGVQSQQKQMSKSAQKDRRTQEQDKMDPKLKKQQESELEGGEQKKQQQQSSKVSTVSTATEEEEKKNTLGPKNGISHQFRGNVSNNMGSTASRSQIKRKPLDKSLMKQVSSEMSLPHQQSKVESQNPAYSSVRGVNKAYKSEADSSLDILLKSFEKSDISSTNATDEAKTVPHPNAVVSEEARFRRQPSEYKPDAGSIPSRRLNHSTNHAIQEAADTCSTNSSLRSTPDSLAHPVAAPKSPRPPAQQIAKDLQNNMYGSPVQQQNLPDQSLGYQQTSSYMGHPQQYQPVYSPMMQPMKSPMMQPMHSPMMQPIHSPMMQPIHSPMVQPMHSPMMQPMHSPMIQPFSLPMQSQSGKYPPPISTNFEQSPSMAYGTLRSVSPGGILPPPPSGAHPTPSRPSQFTDGRPIRFWVRAKYDYKGNDDDELTFRANTLMGIIEADETQDSWWYGAVYNESGWSTAASIPSNFVERLIYYC
ncbi:hypothetical protein [Parasitella parasitica]|uniref:SH3 domain-containing protein n=1 Tax=Parasitella parasitica TaxID=35722 RepID=A0A0B7NA61_9FUNG|nr:hypothetical protein [Parasitella parasitica]